MGFQWDLHDEAWNVMFDQLREYKDEHGNTNTNVPQNHEKLGEWVHNQRTQYKNEKRDTERVDKLEELGVQWDLLEKKCSDMFDELQEYKDEHGNTNVPRNHAQNNLKLGRWVDNQRTQYKKGKLDSERVTKLENLKFQWDLSKKA